MNTSVGRRACVAVVLVSGMLACGSAAAVSASGGNSDPGRLDFGAMVSACVAHTTVQAGQRVLYGGGQLSDASGLSVSTTTLVSGLSIRWTIVERLAAGEDLIVRTDLDKVRTSPVNAAQHPASTALLRHLLVTTPVACDAHGRRLDLTLVRDARQLTIRLPEAGLAHAVYPLRVGFELGSGGLAGQLGIVDNPPVMSSSANPAAPGPVARASAAPALTDARGKGDLERLVIMDLRESAEMFISVAGLYIHVGIPQDEAYFAQQALAWDEVAGWRRENAVRQYEFGRRRLDDAQRYVASLPDGEPLRGRIEKTIEQVAQVYTIPFTAAGDVEAQAACARLNRETAGYYRALQMLGIHPAPIYTALHDAVHATGMHHYYMTMAGLTLTGDVASWEQRVRDIRGHEGEYMALRRTLLDRNTAVLDRVGDVHRLTDSYVAELRAGRNTDATFDALDRAVSGLQRAVTAAPMTHAGEETVQEHLFALRLIFAELALVKRDMSHYNSPLFRADLVANRLDCMALKLSNALAEARSQLILPEETSWSALGINNRDEAAIILEDRTILCGRIENWLTHVRAWHEQVQIHSRNNFATLGYLTAFVRDKADWDSRFYKQIHPVIWQRTPGAVADLACGSEYAQGATVEASLNAMYADLHEIWKCYGEY